MSDVGKYVIFHKTVVNIRSLVLGPGSRVPRFTALYTHIEYTQLFTDGIIDLCASINTIIILLLLQVRNGPVG